MKGPRFELLQTAREEYAMAVRAGETLVKTYGSLQGERTALWDQVSALENSGEGTFDIHWKGAQGDAEEAIALMAGYAKAAAKDKAAPPAKRARIEAALAAAKSNRDALSATVTAIDKEARTALSTVGVHAHEAAEKEAAKESKKLPEELAEARHGLAEAEEALRLIAVGGTPRPGGSCDIQKVDFRNFRFTDQEFKNGTEVDTGVSNQVEYVDLDGNGTKEAVVSIPQMGPHGSSDGTMYFFRYDSLCRFMLVAHLYSGATPGQVKANSYVYDEHHYESSPGEAGLFDVGYAEVEVKLSKGKLRVVKRSRVKGY